MCTWQLEPFRLFSGCIYFALHVRVVPATDALRKPSSGSSSHILTHIIVHDVLLLSCRAFFEQHAMCSDCPRQLDETCQHFGLYIHGSRYCSGFGMPSRARAQCRRFVLACTAFHPLIAFRGLKNFRIQQIRESGLCP